MTLLEHMLLILKRHRASDAPANLGDYLEENLLSSEGGTRFLWFPKKAYYPDGTYKRVWWRWVWFFRFKVHIKSLSKSSSWLENVFVYPISTEVPTPEQKE